MGIIKESNARIKMQDFSYSKASPLFLDAFQEFVSIGDMAKAKYAFKNRVICTILEKNNIDPFSIPEVAAINEDSDIIALKNLR